MGAKIIIRAKLNCYGYKLNTINIICIDINFSQTCTYMIKFEKSN